MIKTAISICFLIFILLNIDFNKFIVLLKKVNLYYLLIGFILGFFRIGIGIHRLYYLLTHLFVQVSFLKVLSDGLIAGYYNLFLPTALGGDIPKIFLLNKHLHDKKRIIATILTERFLGFLSLIVLALVSILSLNIEIENYKYLLTVIIVILTLFIFVMAIITKLSFKRTLKKISKSRIVSIFESIKNFNSKSVGTAFLQSLIYQSFGIIMVYYLGLSLGLELNVYPYFVALPLIWFIMMIPISISGLGLREGAFIYFFMLFGVTKEFAFALSTLFYFQSILVGLVGGVLLVKQSFSKLFYQRDR